MDRGKAIGYAVTHPVEMKERFDIHVVSVEAAAASQEASGQIFGAAFDRGYLGGEISAALVPAGGAVVDIGRLATRSVAKISSVARSGKSLVETTPSAIDSAAPAAPAVSKEADAPTGVSLTVEKSKSSGVKAAAGPDEQGSVKAAVDQRYARSLNLLSLRRRMRLPRPPTLMDNWRARNALSLSRGSSRLMANGTINSAILRMILRSHSKMSGHLKRRMTYHSREKMSSINIKNAWRWNVLIAIHPVARKLVMSERKLRISHVG